jgi:hypothetical protein
MGIDSFFFTCHKCFVDNICTYGSFENNYAGLQLCMGSRTHQSVRNVKSTRGYVRADVIKGQRGKEV